MYILNSNFSLMKQIGDISEEKLNELKRNFNDYPEVIAQKGRPLVFKKGVSAIAVQGDQLTYVTQGDPDEVKVNHIIQELGKLNEVLNLPRESVLVLRVEAIENYNFNVMEKSRGIFNISSDVLNAEGMGLRFIVNQGNFHGDIFIEPYLKDTQKAYFNIILQSSGNININEAQDFLTELFDFAIFKSKEAADDLYKK